MLEKAIEWAPFVFLNDIKENVAGQMFLIYKTLIESAINSYIDKDSNQKVFDTEIDLIYPPNQILFFNYIGELNQDSISFLSEIINILKQKIRFWQKDQWPYMAIQAAMTDFKINKYVLGKRYGP